jgi:hypothetical protein
MSPMLKMGRKGRTLQLEEHVSLVVICAPARRFREDEHVMAVLKKIQGGLQLADMRLWR